MNTFIFLFIHFSLKIYLFDMFSLLVYWFYNKLFGPFSISINKNNQLSLTFNKKKYLPIPLYLPFTKSVDNHTTNYHLKLYIQYVTLTIFCDLYVRNVRFISMNIFKISTFCNFCLIIIKDIKVQNSLLTSMSRGNGSTKEREKVYIIS